MNRPTNTPIKAAAFGLVIKDNQLLLTKRLDVPLWVLPGGGIDEGESPENACKREIQEETGLSATLIRKTHELSPMNRLAQPTHIFLADGAGTLNLTSNESAENRFFPLDDLPGDLFWPHRLWVDEALASDSLIRRPLYEINWMNLFFYILRHPFQVLRFGITCLKG